MAQGLAQQRQGGVGAENLQIVQPGTQVGETVPRGDEDSCCSIARKKRPDLVGRGGVVDDDQNTATTFGVVREDRSVQPRAFLQTIGNGVRRYTECVKEVVKNALRGHLTAVVITQQVMEEDTAGEPTLLGQGSGGDLQDELGFPHPWQPGHRTHRAAGRRLRGIQMREQGLQIVVAAGEGSRGWGETGECGNDLRR
ncbi:hypothetical protein GCM10010129_82360 [Streptomyces fumigatiscleroticus]|nr:hypothetical protein GCM10010129_82360 [Streptomyces fumigatiscleroticus]